jgi:hypothetical protein
MWFKILLTVFLGIYAMVEIMSAEDEFHTGGDDENAAWLFVGRIFLFFVALFFCIGMWVWL